MCLTAHQINAESVNLTALSSQMEIHNFLKEILFVIVLYDRHPEESESFLSLRAMRAIVPTGSIFIHDNSKEPATGLDSEIVYRHDARNPGVSRAYNQALDVAIEQRKKWMLLFDQDTAFTEHFFSKLYTSTLSCRESIAFVPVLRDSTGIVSPFRWMMGRGWRIGDHPMQKKLSLKRYRFANSGLLVECEAFRKVGGYEETIPLDFSDVSFGEKLRQVTTSFTVVDAVLKHDFFETKVSSTDETLDRFRLFCRGGFEYSRSMGAWLSYVSILWRAIHLSLSRRTFTFIRIFLMHCRGSS